jgi:hypothetical protein
MSISAKQYQTRLQSVMKIAVLRELVNEELIKDETTLKNLKEQDFKEGDIFGTGETANYRSRAYGNYKRNLNPSAGGKVDLIVTGAFVDAMYLLKPKGNKYLFGNTDRKRNILKEMYGDNIFGLNQAVFAKYQKEIIAPRFIRKLKLKANIG